MAGLYLLGIVVGILIALLYNGTLFKGEPVPFVMELPNYRLPGAKNVMQLLWEKAKDFLQRAFTVILLATIVVWFLQSFNVHLNLVNDSADSMLAIIATGVDDFSAFASVVATLNNLGPGLGVVADNFTSMNPVAKWILIANMLFGRLEVVTLLVLFTPTFWRE